MSVKKSALRKKAFIYLLAATACSLVGYGGISAGTSVMAIGYTFVMMFIFIVVGSGYLIGSLALKE
jgi:hypothetical protein